MLLGQCKLFASTPSSSNDFHGPTRHFMNNSLFLLFRLLIPWSLLVLILVMMVNLFAFLFLPFLSWLLLGLDNHTFCLLIDGETNLLQSTYGKLSITLLSGVNYFNWILSLVPEIFQSPSFAIFTMAFLMSCAATVSSPRNTGWFLLHLNCWLWSS